MWYTYGPPWTGWTGHSNPDAIGALPVQEKEVLRSRLQEEDRRKAELQKRYENLAKFILTSKSCGPDLSRALAGKCPLSCPP